MTLSKTKTMALTIALSLSSPAIAQDTPIAVATMTPIAAVAPEIIAAPEPKLTPRAVVTKQTTLSVSDSSIECLVKVMNHEAGGEGAKGQKAVGYVVLNRSKSGKFPSSVCNVVYQRHQFTNIRQAKSIPTNKYNQLKSLALSIVSSYSRINDPTSGSLFFHNTRVSPGWRNMIRTIKIGGHVFYRAR